MASFLIPRPNFKIQSAILVIFWIGLFCIAETNAGRDVGDVLGKGAAEQTEFDYFVLAFDWPGTFCRKTQKCCASNGCCQGLNTLKGFTLHGLWPHYNNGSRLSCCSNKEFDIKEISTLLRIMNVYWPSLSCVESPLCNGGKGTFWQYEWEKRGTCASSVLEDEYEFFLTALNVYFKYNVTEVLAEAGFVASNSGKYSLGGIISAIQEAFNAIPEVKCSGDAVKELHLCLSKDFKPRHCAVASDAGSGKVNAKKSCPEYVSLPEYVSPNPGNYETEVAHSTLQYLFE